MGNGEELENRCNIYVLANFSSGTPGKPLTLGLSFPTEAG